MANTPDVVKNIFKNAYQGNFISVREGLEAGADINQIDEAGNTILISAILGFAHQLIDVQPFSYRAHGFVLGMLVNRGDIDLNIANKQGMTALMYATQIGDDDLAFAKITRTIITKLGTKNIQKKTALDLSYEMYCLNDFPECNKMLPKLEDKVIKHELLVDDLLNSNHENYIFSKIREGLFPALEELFYSSRFDPNLNRTLFGRIEKEDASLFYYAVKHNLQYGVELLLTHPDLIIDAKNTNPIVRALLDEREDLAELLLSYPQVKPNSKALIIALHERKYDIAKLILARADFDVNLDNDRTTALLQAVEDNDVKAVKLLLARKDIDVNKYYYSSNRKFGNTPLFEAVKANRVEIVKLLLSSPKIEVNNYDQTIKRVGRYRILDQAINNDSLEVYNLLLESDKIVLLDTDIYTAVYRGSLTLFKELMKNRTVDINAVDYYNDNTLLHYAAQSEEESSIEILKILLKVEGINARLKNGSRKTPIKDLGKNNKRAKKKLLKAWLKANR